MFFQDAQKNIRAVLKFKLPLRIFKVEKTHCCPEKLGISGKTLMLKSLCNLRLFLLSDNFEDLKVEESHPKAPKILNPKSNKQFNSNN